MIESRRYRALLIGNSTFPDDPHNLLELNGPANDLPHLQEALTDSSHGMFGPADVRLVSERTKREVMTSMEEFFRQAERDDVVLLYYSGHGQQDEYGGLYLCSRDTRVDLLRSTGISDTEINGMMRGSAATTHVVILDCCHSGSFKGTPIPNALQGTGRFLITSSRHGQLSNDAVDVSDVSPFTKHLCAALKLDALDDGRSGYISLNDVYNYVLEKVRSETRQIPQRHFDHAVGDVAFARSQVAPGGVPSGEPTPPPAADQRPPQLDVSETLVELRGVQPDETLPAQIIDVFNRGGGDLDWYPATDDGWIRVEKDVGFLRLWLTPSPGFNRGTVHVRDRGTGGSKTIRVLVDVLAEQQKPELELSSTELDFGTLSVGAESPSMSVQLSNRGGGELKAQVTASHPWILLSHFGDTVSVVVDTGEPGHLNGTITIHSAGGEGHVRVHAHVDRGPVLTLPFTLVGFGQVQPGAQTAYSVPVVNAGSGSLTWEFGQVGDFFMATRRGDGIVVQLTGRGQGRMLGSIWVRSNGGQATIDVTADFVPAAVIAQNPPFAVTQGPPAGVPPPPASRGNQPLLIGLAIAGGALALLLVVGIIIAALVAGSSSNSSSSTGSNSSSSTGSGPAPASTPSSAPTPSPVWNVILSDSVNHESYNGYVPNDPDNEHYLVVDVTVENMTQGQQVWNDRNLDLQDTSGHHYSEGQATDPNRTYTVQPGQSTTVTIAYVISDTACHLTLSLMDGSTVEKNWTIDTLYQPGGCS